ncbi:hypothetical protein A9Q99_16755 [Gammaproteobacteria bacterium 45_16_T64]|nr:hypothetical protein A9Q99_16755 [Gammaproteobacteria bacterium 45_16_T64]
MGRNKTFDPDDVLDKAMNLFWQQGYEATSMSQLEKALGINKFSIYNSFGNKHTLFLQALTRYREQRFGLMMLCLTQNNQGLSNIELFFNTLLMFLGSQDNNIGCFMTNTSLELSHKDPEAKQQVLLTYGMLEDGFYQCLQIAQKKQDISPQLHLQDTARFLLTSAQGLLTLGKCTEDNRILQSSVRFILASLKSRS